MIANIKKILACVPFNGMDTFCEIGVGQFYGLSNTTEYPKINWAVRACRRLSQRHYAACGCNEDGLVSIPAEWKPSLTAFFRAAGSYVESHSRVVDNLIFKFTCGKICIPEVDGDTISKRISQLNYQTEIDTP